MLVPGLAMANSGELRTSKSSLALGLAAGGTTGIGLTARVGFPRGWSLSAAGMPFFGENKLGGSMGLQVMRDIWSYGRLRSYALFGAHAMISTTYFESPHLGQKVRKRYDVMHLGPGLGIESRVGRVGFVFEVPLVAAVAMTKLTHLRFPGRVNFGVFPNVAFVVYLGKSGKK